MGKGNRTRTDRASAIIANAAPVKSNSSKKANTITAIVVAIVAVLIVASILVTASVSNGWFQRAKIAIKSDNYKVTGTMLSYYVYSYYLENYQSNASSYGIDTDTPLESQYVDSNNSVSIFDYFAAALESTLKQKVAFAEGAKKAGVVLDDADKQDIEDAITNLKSYATQQLMSIDTFCTSYFGTGVKLKDIREAMELDSISTKYLKSLMADTEKAITDDEINEYVAKNKATFYSADTLQYTFTATLTTADATATEAETAAYTADKEAMLAKANALKAAAVDEKTFKAFVVDYVIAENGAEVFSTAYVAAAKSLDDADKPSEAIISSAQVLILDHVAKLAKGEEATVPSLGDTKYDTLVNTVINSVKSAVITDVVDKLESTITYADPASSSATDTQKFVFAEGRKANESEVVKSEGDSKSTYTVVLVKTPEYRDESITKNVAHILFTGSKYPDTEGDTSTAVTSSAQAKAEEILAEYNKEPSYDKFKALAEQYNEDSASEYDGVTEGQMVTTFNDWCFDETRKEGDVGLVQTTYGFHLIYFRGNGDAAWKVNGKSYVTEEKLTDWCNEAYKTYNVTANEKYFSID